MQLVDKIEFFVISPFLNKEFLQQKYVKEGLSTTQISDEICSAHSTVLKYLRKFKIPIRKSIDRVRGKRKGYGLAYGKRIVKGKLVDHKREQENIQKMRNLRDKEGYSYWKIASIFNSMEISTQTGRGKWHAKTIQQILNSNKR